MAKKNVQPAAAAAAYVPVKEDFVLLSHRDIRTDANFASQSYWKGVFIHFFKNRRAVVGLAIITVIIFFAIVGPAMNSFGYRDIVQYRNEKNKRVVAKGIEPQIPWLHKLLTGEELEGNFAEYTFLFGTDDLGRDLWTRTWYGARVSLLIAFVTNILFVYNPLTAEIKSPIFMILTGSGYTAVCGGLLYWLASLTPLRKYMLKDREELDIV